MRNIQAHEGRWYADCRSRETFCVIYVDQAHGVIDVRDYDGNVDELDFDEWESLDLELCTAPDVWGAAPEDLDSDQYAGDEWSHDEGAGEIPGGQFPQGSQRIPDKH